ncbi:MAG: 5,6-dimethylbenzimidazole synthase [Thaumarchaeota archaeon]|nr:5,6-dimethylbenzimidazole synthase [Nitrososphaerota archaeon]
MDNFSQQEKDGLYKAIHSRRDVRTHYEQIPISDDVLIRILDAAHHAPSVGFSQPWNFILIKDLETRNKVKASFNEEHERSSKLIDDPKRSTYLSLKLEGIIEAPINLCITYDPTRFGPFVIGRTSISETGVYSVCCAIQNLWLAAKAEGIGVGWVSILSNDDLREILMLPDHIEPIAYLTMGYVTHFEKKPDLERIGWLPRLSLNDVIYFEKWNNENDNNRWKNFQSLLRIKF